MKVQIRRGIFETNSSSVHAITVTGEKPHTTSYNGYTIEFTVGEFGWEHRTYYGMYDKAAYLWTTIVHHFIKRVEDPETFFCAWTNREEHRSHLELDVENPDYIKYREAIRQTLLNAGFEDDYLSIQFQEEFDTDCHGNVDFGGIDHIPGLDFVEALVFNEDRLLRYLFNGNSKIDTWNDNEWYMSPEKEEEDDADAADTDWEESDEAFIEGMRRHGWRHFDVPENTEWKYLKDN